MFAGMLTRVEFALPVYTSVPAPTQGRVPCSSYNLYDVAPVTGDQVTWTEGHSSLKFAPIVAGMIEHRNDESSIG